MIFSLKENNFLTMCFLKQDKKGMKFFMKLERFRKKNFYANKAKFNKKAILLNSKSRIVKISVLIFLLFYITVTSISYANLEDNEIINLETIKNEIIPTVAHATEEPDLNAKIGLIFDRSSKTILYEKNGLKQVPMASTTKIMTSIIVLENANLSDVVIIEKKAAGTGGSRLGLHINDKITVHDLLYGLLLRSGNDAAVALAIHVRWKCRRIC